MGLVDGWPVLLRCLHDSLAVCVAAVSGPPRACGWMTAPHAGVSGLPEARPWEATDWQPVSTLPHACNHRPTLASAGHLGREWDTQMMRCGPPSRSALLCCAMMRASVMAFTTSTEPPTTPLAGLLTPAARRGPHFRVRRWKGKTDDLCALLLRPGRRQLCLRF